MGLETGDYICDLVETNPPGTDPVSQGDDHLRLLKHVLVTTFPNICGEVTLTADELNGLIGSGNEPIITTYPPGTGAGVHTFDPSTSWYKVIITGGGGGVRSSSGYGAGGGAAGTCLKTATKVETTADYVVGAGGARGSAGNASTWDEGTNVNISAGGGAVGLDQGYNMPKSVQTGGDVNIPGGIEGVSYWGGGGPSYADNTGPAWGTPGVGGSSGNDSSGTDSFGTPGTDGILIVEEYA